MAGCETNQETPIQDQALDKEIILKTIDNWNEAWKTKDINLAILNYAEDTDWTNAFGDRVKSKGELKKLLEDIFSLDFVMAGNTDYVENDVQFLSNTLAIVRSKSIRKGQENSDGSLMKDRIINQLRVYRKNKDDWEIISHMISQAHEKR